MTNQAHQLDEEAMPTRHKAMTRFAIMTTLPGKNSGGKDHKPSPAQMIEARRAHAAAAQEPLRYAFGDPVPGRSALDKMKKENRA